MNPAIAKLVILVATIAMIVIRAPRAAQPHGAGRTTAPKYPRPGAAGVRLDRVCLSARLDCHPRVFLCRLSAARRPARDRKRVPGGQPMALLPLSRRPGNELVDHIGVA